MSIIFVYPFSPFHPVKCKGETLSSQGGSKTAPSTSLQSMFFIVPVTPIYRLVVLKVVANSMYPKTEIYTCTVFFGVDATLE